MDKFIARENIRHYCDRLETEADLTTRSLLHRLLLQEEDKLGHNHDALQTVEVFVAAAKGHRDRQLELIAAGERDGQDITQVRTRFSAYSEILLAFEGHREKILTRLKESRL